MTKVKLKIKMKMMKMMMMMVMMLMMTMMKMMKMKMIKKMMMMMMMMMMKTRMKIPQLPGTQFVHARVSYFHDVQATGSDQSFLSQHLELGA